MSCALWLFCLCCLLFQCNSLNVILGHSLFDQSAYQLVDVSQGLSTQGDEAGTLGHYSLNRILLHLRCQLWCKSPILS